MVKENRLRWYSGPGYCYVDVDNTLRYGYCDWMPISKGGDRIRPIDDVRAADILRERKSLTI